MKDKIDLIFSDLKNEGITEKQAHQQVLDLFAVMQRSERLPCDYCEEHKPLRYCRECWEQLEMFKQCY